MKYLIICPERTIDKDHPWYWKSKHRGYTQNVNVAGRYTKKEVDEICNPPFVDDYGIPEIRNKNHDKSSSL